MLEPFSYPTKHLRLLSSPSLEGSTGESRCKIRQVPRLTSCGSGSENLTSVRYDSVCSRIEQVKVLKYPHPKDTIAFAEGVLFRKTVPLFWRVKASSLLRSLSLGSTSYQRWVHGNGDFGKYIVVAMMMVMLSIDWVGPTINGRCTMLTGQ